MADASCARVAQKPRISFSIDNLMGPKYSSDVHTRSPNPGEEAKNASLRTVDEYCSNDLVSAIKPTCKPIISPNSTRPFHDYMTKTLQPVFQQPRLPLVRGAMDALRARSSINSPDDGLFSGFSFNCPPPSAPSHRGPLLNNFGVGPCLMAPSSPTSGSAGLISLPHLHPFGQHQHHKDLLHWYHHLNGPSQLLAQRFADGLLLPPFRKPKRIRTAFSPSQLLQLEQAFEKNHYVVGQERKELASNLNLTETQVKVWFQNRRTKHKRMKAEESEHGKKCDTSTDLENFDYLEDDEDVDITDSDSDF